MPKSKSVRAQRGENREYFFGHYAQNSTWHDEFRHISLASSNTYHYYITAMFINISYGGCLFMRCNQNAIIMMVTADIYELPVAMASSEREMERRQNIPRGTINALKHRTTNVYKNKYKFVTVNLEEECCEMA